MEHSGTEAAPEMVADEPVSEQIHEEQAQISSEPEEATAAAAGNDEYTKDYVQEDPLAQEFDLIVLGTGLAESMVAAAAASQGKTVLHVDKAGYYGGEYSSLMVNQVREWCNEQAGFLVPEAASSKAVTTEELEATFGPVAATLGLYTGAHSALFDVPNAPADFPASISAQARRFTINLLPRLCLCRGKLVDALVRSDLCDYVEFGTMEATYMFDDADANAAGLVKVPCSKADVFQSKFDFKEKRTMMRFLQFSLDRHTAGIGLAVEDRNEYSLAQGRALSRPQNKAAVDFDLDPYLDRAFCEFLASCQLSIKLQRIVSYAVALLTAPQLAVDGSVTEATNSEVGMARAQEYLASLGRFGETAFIVMRYGVSEVAQAFCRLSAVHGGIYMLNVTPTHIIEKASADGSRCAAGIVTADGQRLRGKAVVGSCEYFAGHLQRLPLRVLRFVGITSKSIHPTSTRMTVVIPPGSRVFGNKYAIHIIQEDKTCGTTAVDTFMLHISLLVDADKDAAFQLLARVVQHFTRPAPEEAVAPASRGGDGYTQGVDVRAADPDIEPETSSTDGELESTAEAAEPVDREEPEIASDGPTAAPSTTAPLAAELGAAAAAAAAAAAPSVDEHKQQDTEHRAPLLWSMVFFRNFFETVHPLTDIPSNVHIMSTQRGHPAEPQSERLLSFHNTSAVDEATRVFKALYPELEFLPKAKRHTETVDDDLTTAAAIEAAQASAAGSAASAADSSPPIDTPTPASPAVEQSTSDSAPAQE